MEERVLKKFLSLFICMLLVVLAAVPALAGNSDDAVKAAKLDLLAEVAPGDINGAIQMRGFTASPDGKYAYGGFLQGYRHVTKFDTTSGERIAEYVP